MPTNAALDTERKALKALSRAALEAEYKRSHRVSDTREMSKMDLVWAILVDRHGQRTINAYCEQL